MIVRDSRWQLLAICIVSGLLSSVPTILWAWSVWLLPLFPVVAAVTIWAYAFILVFSTLWFAHYCLHALKRLRACEPQFPAVTVESREVTLKE